MGKGIAGLEAAYRGLFTAVLIVLAVLVILCLLRAIIGPRTADRIVSVNMMGTMVIVIIGILTVMMGEGYLADICIIYAMISFLAVIVLTKVYMGVYMEKKEAGEKAMQTGERESAKQKAPAPSEQPEGNIHNDRKSSLGQPEKQPENIGKSSLGQPEKQPENIGKSSLEQSGNTGKSILMREEAARGVSERQNAEKQTTGQEG